MSEFTNFLKFSIAALLGVVSLGTFSQTVDVKADSLESNSPNVMNLSEAITITNTFEQMANIVPEPKVIKNHYVTYSKTSYQVKESIPKEIYYSSNGFKGYLQVTTIIDMGDYFLSFYSGTVIRG
ncbi:TPA: hypothetical protein QCY71_005776 [Bacillus cereus]|nr:hypothetical protein [Bacillus cereus]